jgi:hypothetical protein
VSVGPLGIPWLVCAALAFSLATLFAFVVPRSAGANGLQYVVLRCFHALVWLLLGLAALARELSPGNEQLAERLAQIALAGYGVYLFTFTRAQHQPETD